MAAIRVIKVGGSLFDWPRLPLALEQWLSEQPPKVNILIAGGGGLVDVIRQASEAHSLHDETAHWLCIDAMTVQARLLATLVADAELISTYRALQWAIKTDLSKRLVFDANEFLRKHESTISGRVLPHDWSVTSDSIAARLAEVLLVDELLLLKSADPPAASTMALANRGFVDAFFPAFDACPFQRRFVNLRQAAKCPAAVKGESAGSRSDR